jgi:hypothetical protein
MGPAPHPMEQVSDYESKWKQPVFWSQNHGAPMAQLQIANAIADTRKQLACDAKRRQSQSRVITGRPTAKGRLWVKSSPAAGIVYTAVDPQKADRMAAAPRTGGQCQGTKSLAKGESGSKGSIINASILPRPEGRRRQKL